MPDGYQSHGDYIEWVKELAEARQQTIEAALREAFGAFIETREVEVVVFTAMTALDLANALVARPEVLKPILASCNIAARAIERDLGIRNLNTYAPRLSEDYAKVIAGYIKPFLPPYLEIPSMSNLDRVSYIDKEIRKEKGRWELRILEALSRHGQGPFRKRLFKVGSEQFELDAAFPEHGQIEIGVDIKRIEARRDIHKRCDEIVNKADKLKAAFPDSKFGAVIYYPFIEEHINIQNRLRLSKIDDIVFAATSEESIDSAVRLLLATLEAVKE
ncbi:MAG: hypothetical protein EPO21_02005 [Chloroflexota bacterium]|nr:MAG: hypothetical protein EPO21_02005 [Chloroflexota bacterium]